MSADESVHEPVPIDPVSLKGLSDEELVALLQSVEGNSDLPRRKFPDLPSRKSNSKVRSKLTAIQNYITSLEYNHTGTSYFKKKKDRGLKHVMLTAQQIMREALPIQCVEAVFIAVHLTMGIKELKRFPVSFKSRVEDHTYRHIILAVHHSNKWGALGISRCDKLMNKDFHFESMADLILEFKQSYETIGHELLKVYIGLPFVHDPHSDSPLKWKALSIDASTEASWTEGQDRITRFLKAAPFLVECYARSGILPSVKPRALLPEKGGSGRRQSRLGRLSEPHHRKHHHSLSYEPEDENTSSESSDSDDGQEDLPHAPSPMPKLPPANIKGGGSRPTDAPPHRGSGGGNKKLMLSSSPKPEQTHGKGRGAKRAAQGNSAAVGVSSKKTPQKTPPPEKPQKTPPPESTALKKSHEGSVAGGGGTKMPQMSAGGGGPQTNNKLVVRRAPKAKATV